MRLFRRGRKKKEQPLQKKTRDRMVLARGEKLIMHERESLYSYDTVTGKTEGIESKRLSFVNPVTGEEESTVHFWVKKTPNGIKEGSIKWVHTERAFRNEGLAQELLKRTIEKLREDEASYVILYYSPLENPEAAERIYRRAGFVPLSEVPRELAERYIGGRWYQRLSEKDKKKIFFLPLH